MSLIAWYPLNGDLKDYSENQNDMVNSGLSVGKTGKIGQCYERSLTTSVLYAESKNALPILKKYTWTWWANITDFFLDGTTKRSAGMITNMRPWGAPDNGWNVSVSISTALNIQIGAVYSNSSSGTNRTIFTSKETISLNQWNHFAISNNDGNFKVYLNGKLIGDFVQKDIYYNTEKIKIFNSCMAYTGTQQGVMVGKMNDVRIYDDILSLKEIKEIAKAKILHYNFNQFIEPTENLFKTKSQMNATSVTPTWVDDHTVRFSSAGGTSGIYLNSNTKVETNTLYTFSYNLKKISGTLKHIRGHIQAADGWSVVSTKINDEIVGVYNRQNDLQDDYKNYKIEVILNSGTATTANYNWIQPNYNDATVVEVEISNIQFEKKDHSTPFTKDIRDNLTITDSSGFRNNSHPLTISSTPQWTPDSILGSGCYKFDDSKYICIGNKCKITDVITISAWAYKTDWSTDTASRRILSCTETGGWQLGFNDTSGYVSFPFYKAGVGYYVAKYSRTNVASGWHLLTGVFDGRYGKFYLDGELKDTVDTGSDGSIGYHSSNGIFIGVEAGGSETTPYINYFDGKIDDVRIYATALSDDDIKELYQSKGSVLKNGKIMINEIIESEDLTKTNITKKGQLITNEIIEIPAVNLETKTAYNADWVQLFYHNSKSGTVLFSSDKKEFLKCNTGDKISNLYLLELFRGKDGKFELLLEYESGGTSYNRWKQTSNFTTQPIDGYEAIQCSWTNSYWGGLELSTSSSTWVDGSVNHTNWYYAIGAKVNYSTGGMPHWNGVEPGWVKIWVRCDNPSVFKMYKNGTVSATEFIEN